MAKMTRHITSLRNTVTLPNDKSLMSYSTFLKSSILKNKEVEETTYKAYQNYMQQFLVYLAAAWDNVNLYDEDFFKNAIEILVGCMAF